MILALDYGTRYIGLAITDPAGRLALRHSVIDQKKEEAITALKKILEKERVGTILVGVPISLSGKESQQTHITRDFIAKLKNELSNIEIKEVDETLTSWSADEQIRSEGGKKEDAHMEAARIILETYLTISNNRDMLL